MIFTVTFNPAIDYLMQVGDINFGKTNRSTAEEIHFGGKGINVSAVLSELRVDTTALGFTAGFTGEALEKAVGEMGVKADFIRLKKGNTRINVKLKGNEETEINAAGPHIEEDELNSLMYATDQLANDIGTILVGEEAVKIGLINEVGDFSYALSKLQRMISNNK